MITMPWWAYAAVCLMFTLLGTFVVREAFDALRAQFARKKDRS